MSNYLIIGVLIIVGTIAFILTLLLCKKAMRITTEHDWHLCSHDGFDLITDDSWVPGRWYLWMDKHGNQEVARMKDDCIDHFFPPTEIIKEEDVVAWAEVKKK